MGQGLEELPQQQASGPLRLEPHPDELLHVGQGLEVALQQAQQFQQLGASAVLIESNPLPLEG